MSADEIENQVRWGETKVDRYRVRPGKRVNLRECDPGDTSAFDGSEQEAEERLLRLNRQLEDLQELLYAEHKNRLLVALQAMDTGGKDGTIRHVFEGVNPQGVKVASFKVPTQEELDHDFLWRVHKQTPGKGEITIFNRSHYEDVLVVRVHRLVTPEVWRGRYTRINDFERMLAEEGTTILKFFLHISKGEQKKRLQARLDERRKRWRFNVGDLRERKRWQAYMRAYEDAIGKTSTRWAPWYVVPADHKWYRNLVVATIMVDTLKSLKMRYPEPKDKFDRVVIR
jgi:PPK2 family polyphosphate:nucleotide phosphotransferase